MASISTEDAALSMSQSTEPMQIDYTRDSLEEQHCHLQEHLCFYCCQPNHQSNTFQQSQQTLKKSINNEHSLTPLCHNFTIHLH